MLNDLSPREFKREFREKYINPSYFFVGQEIWARFQKTKLIKCLVKIAAGNDAFIENEGHNFSGWFNKWEVVVKVD